ncbi:MAG TPA: hypothetical protein VJ888_05595 [Mobilitalea sp.]|nr:hypothetical protein [Mobilitalea sp.]
MRKMLVLILGMVLILTSCSSSDLENYIEAVQKTSSINSGNKKIEFSVDMDFNLDNLTTNELKTVRYLEHMEFSTDITYDRNGASTQAISKTYTNAAGIGMDCIVYVNGDSVCMYIPSLGGYVDLTSEEYEDWVTTSKDFSSVFQPVLDKFLDLISDEDVMKENRTYITTDDGQIKTTVYSINIDNEQLQKLMDELVIQIDSLDISLETLLEKYLEDNALDEINLTSEMKIWQELFSMESFSYTTYVDFDGRVVQQDLDLALVINNDEANNGPVRIKVSAVITNSGLGQKQQIEFPEITQDMYLEEGLEDLWN